MITTWGIQLLDANDRVTETGREFSKPDEAEAFGFQQSKQSKFKGYKLLVPDGATNKQLAQLSRVPPCLGIAPNKSFQGVIKRDPTYDL